MVYLFYIFGRLKGTIDDFIDQDIYYNCIFKSQVFNIEGILCVQSKNHIQSINEHSVTTMIKLVLILKFSHKKSNGLQQEWESAVRLAPFSLYCRQSGSAGTLKSPWTPVQIQRQEKTIFVEAYNEENHICI